MGEMYQGKNIQQQPTTTPISQEVRREFYRYWALAALMGYAQVYIETGIPRIWGKFQMSKECSDNRQELLSGMMYWAKTNGIDIDTAVLFVKLEIEKMAKKNSSQDAPWQIMKVWKMGFHH